MRLYCIIDVLAGLSRRPRLSDCCRRRCFRLQGAAGSRRIDAEQGLLGRALQRAGWALGQSKSLKVAADAGYPMAYNNLAIAYRYGEGARPDRVKARALFAEALSRGAYIAGAPLGQMHWHGEGGPVDKAKAISIWIDAAAKGDPFSHERLAWVAELGCDGSASDLPRRLSLRRCRGQADGGSGR